MSIYNGIRHLHTINKHRRLVRRGCFKIGLYWQGLTHDLSKYSPTEFLVGAKYWQGTRSPNNAERDDLGCSYSWMHHKGRNKHHFEYWVDYSLNPEEPFAFVPMPDKYIAEMVMDRIAASKVYMGEKYTQGHPLEYMLRHPDKPIMAEETKNKLEFLLRMLAEEGEASLNKYIKDVFLK